MSWSSFTITSEAIYQSLLTQRGSAYSKDRDSKVAVEMDAYARAIAAGYDQNRRLALQWDPTRCSDFLPRWERIYGLRPLPSATPLARRTALAAKWAMEGQSPSSPGLYDLLQALVPSLSPVVLHTPSSAAMTHIAAGATVPGGISVPAEPAGSPVTWSSSVAHIAIKLTQPVGMSTADFHSAIGSIDEAVDNFLPATTTWDWITTEGFVLDQPNLDVAGFDS